MTEQTPLERAARALCLVSGIDPDRKYSSSDWSPETAPHEYQWHSFLPETRAVLMALREPSDEMFDCEGPPNEYQRGIWQAMIDTALEE